HVIEGEDVVQARLHHGVLERLGGPAILRRCARLVLGDCDRAELGAVHSQEGNEVGAGIDHRDVERPAALLGLCDGRLDRRLCLRRQARGWAPNSPPAIWSPQPRFSVPATAAWIAACAFAAEIGAPYGLAHGILSGMASRLGGAAGCWALAAPTRSQAAPMAAVNIRIFMGVLPELGYTGLAPGSVS